MPNPICQEIVSENLHAAQITLGTRGLAAAQEAALTVTAQVNSVELRKAQRHSDPVAVELSAGAVAVLWGG